MKITYFSLKKFFIVFVAVLSFMISSCSEDSSLMGGEDVQKKPKEISEKTEITTSINGLLVDGYIKNATICIDSNNDGNCLGEIQTKTNNKGEFSLTFSAKENTSHTIIGTGGTDTATNKRFNGTYKNIIEVKDDKSRAVQSLNITPITTIVVHIYIVEIETNPSYSVNNATDKVASSLGLSRNQVSTDPLKNKDVFEKTQQVVQTIAILSSTMQADETNANIKKSFDFVMIQLSVSINTDNHQGELDIDQVVTTLSESTYEGEKISIPKNIVSLAKDNVDNISEKVAESDGLDLTTVQVETQQTTDTITNNVVTEKIELTNDTPAPSKPADNSKPVFTSSNEPIKVYEGKTSVTTIQATDDSAITYSVSGSDGSSFNIGSSGAITFKTAPSYSEQTTYSFMVIATDATGNKATQNLTVNILAVDSVNPVFTSPNEKSVKENQTSVMDLKATDANTITYSIDGTDADKFNLDNSSGKITFKKAPDYEVDPKSYSITATAKDESENSATQTITITITDVDEVNPVFTSSNEKNVSENQTDAITLQATDASSITFHISGSDADKLNLDSSSGKVTFKVAPDYETKTTYSFSAVAQDAEDNNATQDITINIEDIDENAPDNVAPVFKSPTTVNVDEGETEVMTLKAEDTNAIKYTISEDENDSFNINSDSGVVTFKVAPDYEATPAVHIYTFKATATDAKGNEANATITVKIQDVDEIAPVFTSENTKDINESKDKTDAITLKATDTTTITYAISGGDSGKFNIDSSSGIITFKEAPTYADKNSYAFTATATDEAKNKTTQSVTLTILYVDTKAPVFTSSNEANIDESEDEDNITAITLVATDDNTTIYSISGTDSGSFEVNSSTGVVTINKPDYETKKSYTFIAVAKDGFNNSANKKITINIKDVNDEEPIFTSDAKYETPENVSYTFTLVATDGDANTTIQYGITGGSAIVNQSGVVSFTGVLDYETEANITLTATASDGVHTTSQTIEIKLTDVDDEIPIFTSKTDFNVTESSSTKTAFTVIATDDSTPIVYGMNGADSSSFEIDSSSGVVIFKDFPDYEIKSSYSLIVTAEDSLGSQATQNITINIEDINDEKPIFTSQSSYSTNENKAYSFTVKATDKDANSAIKYSITGSDANISESSGVVTLKAMDFETSPKVSFTVSANDGINEGTQDINITIIDVDEVPPELNATAKVSVKEGRGNVVQIKATDESTPITYSISGDDSGYFAIHETDGWISFKTNPDFEAKPEYILDINATDSLGNSAQQILTITIIDVDEDAPKFTSDNNATVDENQATAITLIVEDDSNITYSISGGDSASFDVNSSNGEVTFKTDSFPDYETKTSYSFEAKATDTEGNAGTQDVKIYIKNLNDNSPVFISNPIQNAFVKEINAMTLVVKDADGGSITYAISGGDSAKFGLDSDSGKIKFNTAPLVPATYTFTATATSEGEIVTQSVQLSVQNSTYTSICDENQTFIRFYPDAGESRTRFENVWQEGTKDVIDTNIIHFNKIDNVASYTIKLFVGGGSASLNIPGTTSITSIKLISSSSSNIDYPYSTSDTISLKASYFSQGSTVGMILTAKNSSSGVIATSERINTTIGKEYNASKPPLGLHFTSATSSSVSLGWCKTDVEKYKIRSYDATDSTFKIKDVNDTNITVSIVNSGVKHFFAVADSDTFSDAIDIIPTGSTDTVNFKIDKVTFNQAVQVDMKDGNSSPIIAGKPGVLRVFVEMDSNLPSHKVLVKLSGTNEANETLPSITKEVLLQNSKFDESDSTNKPVTFLLDNESWLKVGNKFSVKVDSNDKIVESDETDNRYPVETEGNKSFNFENAHGMLVHFIPVHVNGKPDPFINQALVDSTKDYLQAMYPLSNVSIVLETPMTNYSYPADNFTNVQGLLDALNTRGKNKVNTEGMPIWTFYMGIIHPDVTALFNGIAESLSLRGLKYRYRTRFLASLAEAPTDTNGYDFFYKTVAHEIAHSHDIKHVKTPLVDGFCYDVGPSDFYGVGRASDDADVDFPYSEGKIGRTGYRQSIKSLYDKTKMYDIMSYCRTTWISDFIYNRIYAYEKELTRVYDDRTITISRSIRSLEPLVEGRLISGRIIHNNWKLTNTVLVKRRDIISKAKEDFSLKVELVNGDIFEVPVELINLSSTSMKTFRVFIPSTKDIKVIQVVNRHNKDVITLDFK